MSKATVSIKAEGSQAKKEVREIGKEAEKAGKKIDLLQRKLNAIKALESKLGANLKTANFDTLLKKFTDTEKKMRSIASGAVPGGGARSGRSIIAEVTKDLGNQETKLDRMNKKYADMNRYIAGVHKELTATGREITRIEKRLGKAPTSEKDALKSQLDALRSKKSELYQKWKEPQSSRDILGAQIATARGVESPKLNEFYRQQEIVNAHREKLEQRFTQFANDQANKRFAYSRRLYEKEWADALREDKKRYLAKTKLKDEFTVGIPQTPVDTQAAADRAAKASQATSRRAYTQYRAERGEFGPSGRGLVDMSSKMKSSMDYSGRQAFEKQMKKLAKLRDKMIDDLFDEDFYRRGVEKGGWRSGSYRKDEKGQTIMPMNDKQRLDRLEKIRGVEQAIEELEKGITKEAGNPARTAADRNRYKILNTGEAKYQAFLDKRADDATKSAKKGKTGMSEQDWDNVWGTDWSTQSEDKAEKFAKTFAKANPKLVQFTDDVKRATKANDAYARATQAVSREIDRQQTKMDKFPARSKQYKILQKDLGGLYDTLGLLTHADEKYNKQGLKKWSRQIEVVNENRRSIDKMGRSAGIAGSKLGRFSIVMSGIAATLFVFQTVSRVIAAILRPITNMEKAMSRLKTETKYTAGEIKNLVDESRRIGKTGQLKAEDFINQVIELERQGVGDPAKILSDIVERQQKAGAGTFGQALKNFGGQMRTWSETHLRGVADDLRKLFEAMNSGLESTTTHTQQMADNLERMHKELDVSIKELRKRGEDRKNFDGGIKFGNPLPEGANKWSAKEWWGFATGQKKNSYGSQTSIIQQGQLVNQHKDEENLILEIDRLQNVVQTYREQQNIASRDLGQFMHNVDGLDAAVEEASKAYRIHKDVIYSLIKAESNFDPLAVSQKGAMGLGQLMPATAKEMGVNNAFDVRENIMGTVKYLRQMLDRYDQDLKTALAAYNAGPTAVDKYGGVPPYEETQAYVTKIEGYISLLNGSLDQLKAGLQITATQAIKAGHIKWEELLPQDLEEYFKTWSKQLSSDIKTAFDLLGQSLPGQFTERDRQANIGTFNLRDQYKKQGLEPEEIERRIKLIKQKLDFDRGQELLGPAMRDFLNTFEKLGQTSATYWNNEIDKHNQFISELKERNALFEDGIKLTEEQIKALDKMGLKAIKNRRERPQLEAMESIEKYTQVQPPRLAQARQKAITTEFVGIRRQLAEAVDELTGMPLFNDSELVKQAELLERQRAALKETDAEFNILRGSFESFGTVDSRLFDLEEQRLWLKRMETAVALGDEFGEKIADADYDKAVRALKKELMMPTLDAYETLYAETGRMGEDHLVKRLQMIELERKAYVDLTKDEVAAAKWAEREKIKAQSARLRDSGGMKGVMDGIKAGNLEFELTSKTTADRVADSWLNGMDRIVDAWDEGFFTVMNFEFENLRDSGIACLQSLRDVTTDILNDILKSYARTLIQSGLKSLIGGGFGGNGSTILSTGGIVNSGGGVYNFATGGWLNEPVVGIGTRSGAQYNLAESGSELIVPKNKVGNVLGGREQGGLAISVPVTVNGDAGRQTANRLRDQVEQTVIRVLREEMR